MTAVAITCSHIHTEFSWLLLDGFVSTAIWIQILIALDCFINVMSDCVCVCVFFSLQIITQYVYELLEKKCNMTKAILPVSTQSEKRHFPLWFMPLKIKGSIKYENWRKCSGFRVWLWYWVSCLKKKRKGDCEASALLILYQSLSFSLSISLTFSLTLLSFFYPPYCPHLLCKSVSSTN